MAAFVELASPEIRAWGAVAAEAVKLHAARPIVIAGYVAPGPGATLRWRGGRSGTASVELGLPHGATARVAARDAVPCDALSLGGAAFVARDAIEETTIEMTMLSDRPVTLTLEPGGTALAELRYAAAVTPRVDIVERRDDHVRIVVLPSSLDPSQDVALVGWVPATALAPHSHGFGGSWGQGAVRAPPRRRPGGTRVTCAHAVPIVGEIANERHLVGVIAAGVVLELPPRRGRRNRGSAGFGDPDRRRDPARRRCAVPRRPRALRSLPPSVSAPIRARRSDPASGRPSSS